MAALFGDEDILPTGHPDDVLLHVDQQSPYQQEYAQQYSMPEPEEAAPYAHPAYDPQLDGQQQQQPLLPFQGEPQHSQQDYNPHYGVPPGYGQQDVLHSDEVQADPGSTHQLYQTPAAVAGNVSTPPRVPKKAPKKRFSKKNAPPVEEDFEPGDFKSAGSTQRVVSKGSRVSKTAPGKTKKKGKKSKASILSHGESDGDDDEFEENISHASFHPTPPPRPSRKASRKHQQPQTPAFSTAFASDDDENLNPTGSSNNTNPSLLPSTPPKPDTTNYTPLYPPTSPTAPILTPSPQHLAFLTTHLPWTILRLATVCVALLRMEGDRAAHAVGLIQFAVDFFGPELWAIATRHYILDGGGAVDEWESMKACPADCIGMVGEELEESMARELQDEAVRAGFWWMG